MNNTYKNSPLSLKTLNICSWGQGAVCELLPKPVFPELQCLGPKEVLCFYFSSTSFLS